MCNLRHILLGTALGSERRKYIVMVGRRTVVMYSKSVSVMSVGNE